MKHVIKSKRGVISEVEREITVTKIALTGLLRSGKDACANHLYLRHNFDTVAFGDKLKAEYHALFPWEPIVPKPRAGYQKLGQLIRQEFDEDVWVRHVERKVDEITEKRVAGWRDDVGIVITDARQPNEIAWARENGFTIIRVTAPEAVRLERARKAGDDFKAEDLAHETESYVPGFDCDFEISNEGSLDELYAKVDAVLAEIKKEAQ